MSETFQSYIAGLVAQHGTAQRIADAIEMSLSAFSRGVRTEQTLSVDNCLRLAEFTGDSPARILRLAGKGEIAERIQRLFGPERQPLSDLDRQLLALTHEAKTQVLRLVRSIEAMDASKPAARRRA